MRACGVLFVGLLISTLVACSEAGTSTADNGGIGGTGVSQGAVDSFGSIFVTGIEWDLTGASVELDGAVVADSELRLGMQVRVIGDIDAGGLTGTAASVSYDTSLMGPVESSPTNVFPDGSRVSFSVLGNTVVVDQAEVVFGPGLSLPGLALGQLLRISGFIAGDGTVRATRVDLLGSFPAVAAAELEGIVANLTKNPDGSGIFDIGTITVRYTAMATFSGLTVADLANGIFVDVSGTLRASETELDADEIEAADDLLSGQDFEDIEITGLVSQFVSLANFRVDGVQVDASAAVLDPPSFAIANDVLVEAEGSLSSGVLAAVRVESGEAKASGAETAALEASTTFVAPGLRELTMLGVTVAADGDTEIQDERDGEVNFGFDDIQVGDWLKVEGTQVSPGRVVAHSIVRDSVGSEVLLRGPVTMLDTATPLLDVVGQAILLDGMTEYRDEISAPRTEEEFFRTPGDVSLGDVVTVLDEAAADPSLLLEVDRVVLE